MSVLDNPVWAALTGPHAHLAQTLGSAARYRLDMSPFAALADPADPQSWRDLALLVGPDTKTTVIGSHPCPAGWQVVGSIAGVQLVGTALRAQPDPEAVPLTSDDVPAMLDLVSRTKPGPFLPRTIELGSYLGIRRDGVLVAMAGERMHPPGWTEISAVCTDAAYRGQGLAARLMRAVAVGIGERGEMAFLHAAATNTNAIRRYESMGFSLRHQPEISFLQTPV